MITSTNEQAEKAAIGSVILDQSIFDKIQAWIRIPDAFYYKINQKIWLTIIDLYRHGVGIDIITVVNRFKEKFNEDLSPSYVAEIQQQAINVENSEYYAKIVWSKYVEREVLKTSKKLDDVSRRGGENIEKTLLTFQKYIEELQNLTPNKDRSMDVIAPKAANDISKGASIIEYGLPFMDSSAGGMTRGEYVALGGRPGNGKTTLMINIVKALAEQGLKVMVFNREMTNTSAITKIMIRESDKLTMDSMRKKDLPDNVKEEINVMRDLIVDKYATVRMYDDIISLDESMVEIRRWEPDVVIDDFIQLIKVNGKRRSDRRFEIEDITNEYKWVLKKTNSSGILISQLSREVEKRIDSYPVMSDFDEGGTIEQGAESCVFVYYPYYFKPNDYSPLQNEVVVKKARYGKIGTFTVPFDGNKCKFGD